MGTPWDARTYHQTSEPQQAWASEVLARLAGIAEDATLLDIGRGTGRMTERLLALVPRGRVLGIDASAEMVTLARGRLGGRAQVWCQDVLDLELDDPVDGVFSTATMHWVRNHDRLWARLARVLRPGGVLEVQVRGRGQHRSCPRRDRGGCTRGGSRARRPVALGLRRAAGDRAAPAGGRLHRGPLLVRAARDPPAVRDAFVRTSILAAHLERLPEERREPFAAAVVAGVRLPLDYVRLNVSAVRSPAG